MRQSYGCVKCQSRHYTGNPLFKDHIMFQSKHGLRDELESKPVSHTPGPWKFGSRSGHIFASDGTHIATIHGLRLGYGPDPNKTLFSEEAMNNARFIVRACNCHDDLLAACRALLMHSACPMGHEKADRWSEACAQARAIIARIEGRTA